MNENFAEMHGEPIFEPDWNGGGRKDAPKVRLFPVINLDDIVVGDEPPFPDRSAAARDRAGRRLRSSEVRKELRPVRCTVPRRARARMGRMRGDEGRRGLCLVGRRFWPQAAVRRHGAGTMASRGVDCPSPSFLPCPTSATTEPTSNHWATPYRRGSTQPASHCGRLRSTRSQGR